MGSLERHTTYRFKVSRFKVSRFKVSSFRVRRVASAFPALTVLVSVALAFPVFSAPAPVVDATAQGPAIKDIQTRLKRVETRLDNQGLVDLMSRFDQLQREMEKIIGNLEVQNHQLQVLKKQQKDLYEDLDRRLRKLEQSPGSNTSSSSAPTVGGAPVTPVPVQSATVSGSSQAAPSQQTPPGGGSAPTQAQTSMSNVEENVARSAYERAFNLLKQRRYDLAITSFKAFLETYPYATYADNAQYWIGEANYASKKYKVALDEFQKVVSKYPNSPKRADALLKIGYTYVELDNKKMAKHTFNTILKSYPGTTAAKLAEKRIKTLK